MAVPLLERCPLFLLGLRWLRLLGATPLVLLRLLLLLGATPLLLGATASPTARLGVAWTSTATSTMMTPAFTSTMMTSTGTHAIATRRRCAAAPSGISCSCDPSAGPRACTSWLPCPSTPPCIRGCCLAEVPVRRRPDAAGGFAVWASAIEVRRGRRSSGRERRRGCTHTPRFCLCGCVWHGGYERRSSRRACRTASRRAFIIIIHRAGNTHRKKTPPARRIALGCGVAAPSH